MRPRAATAATANPGTVSRGAGWLAAWQNVFLKPHGLSRLRRERAVRARTSKGQAAGRRLVRAHDEDSEVSEPWRWASVRFCCGAGPPGPWRQDRRCCAEGHTPCVAPSRGTRSGCRMSRVCIVYIPAWPQQTSAVISMQSCKDHEDRYQRGRGKKISTYYCIEYCVTADTLRL